MKKGVKMAELSMNDDAAAYYEHYKGILETSGRFKDGDERGLARLCHLWSVADKLEKEMNDAWGVALSKTNLPIYDKVSKSILLLEHAFQMNPNSRKENGKKKEDKPTGKDRFKMEVSKTA